jgi:hypothetical protein
MIQAGKLALFRRTLPGPMSEKCVGLTALHGWDSFLVVDIEAAGTSPAGIRVNTGKRRESVKNYS